MELDKRIKEGKRPLTCFDTEQAKQFIGKECYLSNSFSGYADLNSVTAKRILDDVSNTNIPYSGNPAGIYCYCLPCEWVKPEEPEKKYREYKDLDEFFDDVGCTLGDVIRFRKKGSFEEEYHTLLTGFKGNARVNIGLGDGGYYSLSDLFSLFELYTADGWRPFGIEE